MYLEFRHECSGMEKPVGGRKTVGQPQKSYVRKSAITDRTVLRSENGEMSEKQKVFFGCDGEPWDVDRPRMKAFETTFS